MTTIGGYIKEWGANAYVTQGIPTEGGFVAVAAGWDHGLALTSSGELRAWSTSPFEATYHMGTVPAGITQGFVAIAAGEWFNLALRSNGTIFAWGDNDYAKLNINNDPENVAGAFTAIAAGGHHGVALRANGTIKAWGGVGYASDECTDSPYPGSQMPTLLVNAPFVSIGAGHSMTYGVLADGQGTVVGWGCSCAAHDPSAVWMGNQAHTDGYYVFGTRGRAATGGYEHGLRLSAKTSTMSAWGSAEGGCNVSVSGNPPNTVPAAYQALNTLMIGANNVGRHNVFIYDPPAN